MAAALLGRTEVGVREYGTRVTVPSSPKARLMYYLDCVCGLLDMSRESNLDRLRAYTRPQSLSEEETDALIALCFILSPDDLIGKVIFQDENLCRGTNNTFYELSAVSRNIIVSESVMIGGQTRTVRKIMACDRQWLERNWIHPMKTYAPRLARIARGRPGIADRSSGCCCTIL